MKGWQGGAMSDVARHKRRRSPSPSSRLSLICDPPSASGNTKECDSAGQGMTAVISLAGVNLGGRG